MVENSTKKLGKNNDDLFPTLLITSPVWLAISGLLFAVLADLKDASRLNIATMPPVEIFYIIAGILMLLSTALIICYKNWHTVILPFEFIVTMYWIIEYLY